MKKIKIPPAPSRPSEALGSSQRRTQRLVTSGKAIKNVAITGGSGKAGRFVVRHLLESGYKVVNLDWKPPLQAMGPYMHVNLTDFGETADALSRIDAVVHLAAIPMPGGRPAEATFRENVGSTFNIFQAAQMHRMKRVVWASSETVLGLPFENPEPAFVPIDESHPDLPNSTYSLSKVTGETIAGHFARWMQVPFVGLRFSNVMHPDEYANFPSFQDDPHKRKWNLWGYVDGRDVAQGCRLGLKAGVSGAENFILAAADTVMAMKSADLMAQVYPAVRLKRRLQGNETLLCIDKARKLLGYKPAYSWRNP